MPPCSERRGIMKKEILVIDRDEEVFEHIRDPVLLEDRTYSL